MQASSVGAFAPALLLCAALGSWSLISLLFLVAFFVVQYYTQKRALDATSRPVLWVCVVLLATTVIVTEGIAEIVWVLLGTNWSPSDSAFLEFLGLTRLNPGDGSLGLFFSLLPQFAVALIAVCALYQEQQFRGAAQPRGWDNGSNWRGTLKYFVLPTFQVLVGVARPSWIALPYFVLSCVGLLHWSVTGTTVGLSWAWRPLLWCTGIHIFLLYVYQLPLSVLNIVSEGASYVGLFKISKETMGWPEVVQAVALIGFYIMLCFAINNLEGQQSSQQSLHEESVVEELPRYYADGALEDSLVQTLLPSLGPASDTETIPLSRRWDADQRSALVFRHATINFITYGFPICLIALISWSFIYASLCAFGLLLYVGYIFYAFPSIHILRQLNPVLLGFILAWTLSTYVFNAAFSVITKQSETGMEIWHSIGLWHYLTPGLFIFAQFALGLLVATDIFVSNVIIKRMTEAESPSSDEHGLASGGDQEDWKVLIMAVIAWCLRRSAYVICLVLILIVGMKDDLLHAVYIGFFLVYLVSSKVAHKTRKHLILFCEIHFAALYLLQLDWISGALRMHEAQLKPILLHLGLWNKGTLQDFLSIALLLCFLAVQSHGVKVLSSLSATIQQSPDTPLGWGLLRVGSGRSVILSVYASQHFGHLQEEPSDDVNWVTSHLASMAEAIRSTYRSFGTYVVYGTVLIVINFVEPNYISLGYLCLLLLWVIGRQIMGHTESQLWYPLMIFAGVVFVFRYTLSSFPNLQEVLGAFFSLHDDFGFDAEASLVGHLWDSLAILIAMQLYRFERAQGVVRTGGQEESNVPINSDQGFVGFVRRVLILHCGKVLTLAVFYASISPVSATGFLYLLMLIVTCNMSKTSRLPGQLYSFYTGLLLVTEYLFQMWGDWAQMFPGQLHGDFVYWLGFRVYEEGFSGTELGLRSKTFVVVACILQYCSFHWLDQLPDWLRGDERYEEPCVLFLPRRRQSHGLSQATSDANLYGGGSQEISNSHGLRTATSDVGVAAQAGILHKESSNLMGAEKRKVPKVVNLGLDRPVGLSTGSDDTVVTGSSKSRDPEERFVRPILVSPWGSAKESRRWTKRAGLLVKQERYEAQLRTLSIYAKHIVEHCFQLYGLETSMLSLLVASFTLLNIISLFYVLFLGLCIILSRPTLRIIWPLFVVLSAFVLVTEYAVLGMGPLSWHAQSEGQPEILCNNCADKSTFQRTACWRCWLGLVVDDRSMVGAHFMVFLISCLWLRAMMLIGSHSTQSIRSADVPASDRLAWKEMSFESSAEWTWFENVRFFFYRHLLHLVLLLVFATGTLQYDVLHLGYLTFSLVLFRMRSTIMVKRNAIFRFLRLYNFILIGASLIYQAPFFGSVQNEGCAVLADVYNIVGLYKMRFGFRITARSAVVDITIFCVAALQSFTFRSREFEQVLRYLESEQVEARVHAQEHKAAWKKEHLQRIREMEEKKVQRRLQVEKMKTDMLHQQLQLDVLNSTGKFNEVVSPMVEIDSHRGHHPSFAPFSSPKSGAPVTDKALTAPSLQRYHSDSDLLRPTGRKEDAIVVPPAEHSDSLDAAYHVTRRRAMPPVDEVSVGTSSTTGHGGSRAEKLQSRLQSLFSNPEDQVTSFVEGEASSSSQIPSTVDSSKRDDEHLQKQGYMSGVHLLGDGVAQVHNLGNRALASLVGLLNLERVEGDDSYSSSTDDEARTGDNSNSSKEIENAVNCEDLEQPDPQAKMKIETWRRVYMLYKYFWVQIGTNTDIVCYMFFVLAFTWNFSILTLVYPAMLFLYALLANPGPKQQFWFIMLVYTELNILLQYMFQIHVQNCAGQEVSLWLHKLGIPGAPMDRSFVISVLPLFLVYLTTLVQSSIKARDGEWLFVDDRRRFPSSRRSLDLESQNRDTFSTLKERLWKIGTSGRDTVRSIRQGLWWYIRALANGSEAPPHFVQVSLHVGKWPEDGIQPERIESQINRLLEAVHEADFSKGNRTSGKVNEKESCSRVRVESIESNPDKPSMAVAVLEVIYAAPRRGLLVGEHYQTLTPAADVAVELQIAKDEDHAEDFLYPIISVIPGGKREVDVYAMIFGIDLISFFFVALFYQSTAKHSDTFIDVSTVEDQFPKEFVYVLMTLFFLIMADRVFYLWSFATGKVLLYFFCLGLYTAYVWDFVWSILLVGGTDHERNFMQLLPLRGIYILKALSLSLQAVQLRYGLPHRSTLSGQFLTRKVNSTSWIGFRLYRSLPFLYELRCLLDWSCTTTALSMYDWLKLEDIYASLFLVQCDIKMMRSKHPFGQKRGVWIKFASGVLLFCALIGVIWAPMLIYSSGNPTNIVNEITDVRTHIEVRTGGVKFTLFETGLCQVPFLNNVQNADSSSGDFNDPYRFVSGYDLRDVQLMCCEMDSESLWMIPPPTLKSLLDSIDDDLTIVMRWEFNRDRPKGKEVTLYSTDPTDPAYDLNSTLIASQFRGVLNGTQSSFNIPKFYPRYFRIPGTGDVRILETTNLEREYVSGNLSLNREGSTWWSFQRDDSEEDDGCGTSKGPMAITVSEEVPKGIIGETLSKFSIWSLYITFVYTVGRFIRLQCADIRMRIPFENFPACDRLVAICEDIYAARAERELELEEGLFWTLIKIYRSPHILMEYTKIE